MPLKVSFFLFAYNQELYIREACEAALAQDYADLEVVFSDDCSTDRTFEVMQEVARVYQGPHKIVLNRNRENQGLIGHVNLSHQISSGDLIVVAAGDFKHKEIHLGYKISVEDLETRTFEDIMQEMENYYKNITPKYPEKWNPKIY